MHEPGHKNQPRKSYIFRGFFCVDTTFAGGSARSFPGHFVCIMLEFKAVKKGRTKEEVDQVTCWLTGYSRAELEGMAEKTVSYGDFFRNAPQLNENRRLIKGVVCWVRVEEIQEPLMQEIRYLDKLVDELAKGKSMEKILRK